MRSTGSTKRLLVLDKSVARGISRNWLRRLSETYRFLLPSALFYEIATEQEGWSEDQWRRHLGGLDCVWREDIRCLVKDELEHAAPAARIAGPMPFRDFPWDQLVQPSCSGISNEECARFARLLLTKETKEKAKALPKGEERWFFSRLADHLRALPIAKLCVQLAERGSLAPDAHVCHGLSPGPRWYAWSLVLVTRAWFLYRFYKWQGDPDKMPADSGAASAVWDWHYVIHLAEADGLVSNDKTQLAFAKACWPVAGIGPLRPPKLTLTSHELLRLNGLC